MILSGDISGGYTWGTGRVTTGFLWVGARDAVKHPAMHGAGPRLPHKQLGGPRHRPCKDWKTLIYIMVCRPPFVFILVSGLAYFTGIPAENLIRQYKNFLTPFLWEQSYFRLRYPKKTSLTRVKIQ